MENLECSGRELATRGLVDNNVILVNPVRRQ